MAHVAPPRQKLRKPGPKGSVEPGASVEATANSSIAAPSCRTLAPNSMA